MKNISVNFIVLLINGIPQSFLAILALQLFTSTKINVKKYILLSLICSVSTYLFRFLPIALGVNTVLSLFVIILTFQFAYKHQLSEVIHTIVAAVGSFIMIAISEVFNMLLLMVIYGQPKGEELFTSSDGLVKGISTSPTNIFFAVLIFISHLILKWIKKRKTENGKTGTKSGT